MKKKETGLQANYKLAKKHKIKVYFSDSQVSVKILQTSLSEVKSFNKPISKIFNTLN